MDTAGMITTVHRFGELIFRLEREMYNFDRSLTKFEEIQKNEEIQKKKAEKKKKKKVYPYRVRVDKISIKIYNP